MEMNENALEGWWGCGWGNYRQVMWGKRRYSSNGVRVSPEVPPLGTFHRTVPPLTGLGALVGDPELRL